MKVQCIVRHQEYYAPDPWRDPTEWGTPLSKYKAYKVTVPSVHVDICAVHTDKATAIKDAVTQVKHFLKDFTEIVEVEIEI
jgi:LmbE family N-acetylglucosaminyl deacetylase